MPASGYYEWRPVEDGKQPYFISAADGGGLSIAGLWDEWKDPETGETITSGTVIVTPPTSLRDPFMNGCRCFLGGDESGRLAGRKGRHRSIAISTE